MSNKTIQDSELPEIVRRKVNIDFGTDTHKHWVKARPKLEEFLIVFSCFLPDGERFFIRSVRHYRERITDPELQDQVSRFIFQEAMHTKEHGRLNDLTRDTFPIAKWVERIGSFLYKTAEKILPAPTLLAISCAIEHFTAMVSDRTLRSGVSAHADPDFAQLWTWHAAEEIEHKAVCFDVYHHVLGKGPLVYLNRVIAMLVVTIFFTLAIMIGTLVFKLEHFRDRPQVDVPKPVPEPAQARKRCLIGGYCLVHILAEFFPMSLYLSYYKPGFHPWEHDNRDLLDAWKQNNQGFGLNTKTI